MVDSFIFHHSEKIPKYFFLPGKLGWVTEIKNRKPTTFEIFSIGRRWGAVIKKIFRVIFFFWEEMHRGSITGIGRKGNFVMKRECGIFCLILLLSLLLFSRYFGRGITGFGVAMVWKSSIEYEFVKAPLPPRDFWFLLVTKGTEKTKEEFFWYFFGYKKVWEYRFRDKPGMTETLTRWILRFTQDDGNQSIMFPSLSSGA